jgi:hypothetical protein
MARVKQDAPTFTDWTQNELTLSKDLVSLLSPLKIVELSPKAGQPKILVAVAPDGKTYRFTNDPDLAAIVDITGLKSSLARDAAVFAQQLSALRSFPADAKVINSSEEVPQGNEVVQKIRKTIAPVKITTDNKITTLSFFFIRQLGGLGVFKMTVIAAGGSPTQIETQFLGYTK